MHLFREIPGRALEPQIASSADAPGYQASQEHWMCTFEARAGGLAHAGFSSAEDAQAFAERHAEACGLAGKWTHADGLWALTTPVGDYLVRRTTQPAESPRGNRSKRLVRRFSPRRHRA
jgi:hypothetical protein